MLHRADGPAFIERDATTGTIIFEAWRKDDKLHRMNGSALIERPKSGAVTREVWWINGKEVESVSARPALRSTSGISPPAPAA